MALPVFCPSFLPSSIRHNHSSPLFFRHLSCCSSSSSSSAASSGAQFVTRALKNEDREIVRRSANWQPSIWDYDFVQSLSVDYTEDKYTEQVQRLKKEIKGLFEREMNQVVELEFIDVVQRLGLGYHFETEIKSTLGSIYHNSKDAQLSDDVYVASLRFRLLRQHGYNVPQDVFQRFMNPTSTFNESHNKDVKGLLGLYEASFHGLEGEAILDEAWNFAYKHLKNLNLNKVPTNLASNVSHALDLPIHWRPNRLEARWFMDMYEKQQDMIPSLLKLAKLDFNLVQSIHRKELSSLARWDIIDVDRLPPTIRDSFMALYNTTNEIGYWTMRERGINPIPYLRKLWADECKAYMKEVHWYSKGIKPTLKEYLNVATNSAGGPVMLLASYFLTTDKLMEEALDYVSKIPSVLLCSAKILRLINDLSTSSYELARGDNFKALECYMNEAGASEEAAREHIRHMVRENWKRMNEVVFEDYPIPGLGPFLGACLNLARASHTFYRYGMGSAFPSRNQGPSFVGYIRTHALD
ncbi:hypothetical protein BT93_L3816 [Corymbia citriodora subsp. variegata]|uniref:Uncharacterized protein n=1 Tax=Corymbia citriodora subsp. variegata TaxID=360336 RepID=A0A8T0CV72_CORYI|nr:hypothetical protein BT93_L3816 [Corymbia citriodora subsp. variegata]